MVASPRDPILLPVSVQDLAAPDETSEWMVVFASIPDGRSLISYGRTLTCVLNGNAG